MNSLLKHSSAWVPIALSLAMLAFIYSYIALVGVSAPSPDADEGVAAHLFQLWLVVEAVLVPYFAFSWLPRVPREASVILLVQIIAVIAACAPVFILEM